MTRPPGACPRPCCAGLRAPREPRDARDPGPRNNRGKTPRARRTRRIIARNNRAIICPVCPAGGARRRRSPRLAPGAERMLAPARRRAFIQFLPAPRPSPDSGPCGPGGNPCPNLATRAARPGGQEGAGMRDSLPPGVCYGWLLAAARGHRSQTTALPTPPESSGSPV